MKKKIITLCLVIAMLSVAVIGGTLAYFTDVDRATNEFTVGNVSIDLYETVDHKDASGTQDKSGAIKVDNKENPATLEKIGEDTDKAFAVTYGAAMPGDVLTKVVTVENDGTEDAYVAVAIKQLNYGRSGVEGTYNFNALIDDYYEGKGYGDAEMQKLMDELFSGNDWNHPVYTHTSSASDMRYFPDFNVDVKEGEKAPQFTGMVDPTGANNHYNAEHQNPVLLGVDYLVSSTPDKGATYSVGGHCAMLTKDAYSDLQNGARVWVYYIYMPAKTQIDLDISITVPAAIDEYSINAFNGMVLDVQSSAIQATGFATAKEAFAELNATYPIVFKTYEVNEG